MADAGNLIIIDMGRWAEECQLCGQLGYLDYCVPFYEEPVHDDIGTVLPNGDTVGGMSCCKSCFDKHEAAATLEKGDQS